MSEAADLRAECERLDEHRREGWAEVARLQAEVDRLRFEPADLGERIAQAIEAAKTGDAHDDNVRASDARIARNTT